MDKRGGDMMITESITFATEEDAWEFLQDLKEIAAEKGYCSLGDFLRKVKYPDIKTEYDNMGWSSSALELCCTNIASYGWYLDMVPCNPV